MIVCSSTGDLKSIWDDCPLERIDYHFHSKQSKQKLNIADFEKPKVPYGSLTFVQK